MVHELTDAFTDANAVMVANKNVASGSGSRPGNVHKGFRRSALYLRDYLQRAIDSEFKVDGKLKLDALYVTGHSLGAAVAVVAAENIYNDPDLSSLKSVLRGVYTYGQPMVGDPVYAKACVDSGFASLVFRHVYGVDSVPPFPRGPRANTSISGRSWSRPKSAGKCHHASLSAHSRSRAVARWRQRRSWDSVSSSVAGCCGSCR